MKILTFCDFYLPGYKAGGPIKSLSNMVGYLGSRHDIRLVTRDRDDGDSARYANVEAEQWTPLGEASVLYRSPSSLTLRHLRRTVRSIQPDVVYLNSFFSPAFTVRFLLLRRLGLIPPVPTILAPRGELAGPALEQKRRKKIPYLWLARRLGLYRDLIWHASTEWEKADVERWLATTKAGRASQIVVVPNLPGPTRLPPEPPPARPKRAGALDVVFLSRISRMKNLEGALEYFGALRGEVHFHIYGPVDDENLWQRCEDRIRALPPNIKVKAHGPVASTDVRATLSRNHVFLLPSLGENFGHVILEALFAGCPALISDRTAWRGMEARGLGWDLPLDRPDAFAEVLQRLIDMDEASYAEASRRAYEGAAHYYENNDSWEQSLRLFSLAGAQHER